MLFRHAFVFIDKLNIIFFSFWSSSFSFLNFTKIYFWVKSIYKWVIKIFLNFKLLVLVLNLGVVFGKSDSLLFVHFLFQAFQIICYDFLLESIFLFFDLWTWDLRYTLIILSLWRKWKVLRNECFSSNRRCFSIYHYLFHNFSF